MPAFPHRRRRRLVLAHSAIASWRGSRLCVRRKRGTRRTRGAGWRIALACRKSSRSGTPGTTNGRTHRRATTRRTQE
eukprot:8281933-Alexandrium_andersonii.AAC.1